MTSKLDILQMKHKELEQTSKNLEDVNFKWAMKNEELRDQNKCLAVRKQYSEELHTKTSHKISSDIIFDLENHFYS